MVTSTTRFALLATLSATCIVPATTPAQDAAKPAKKRQFGVAAPDEPTYYRIVPFPFSRDFPLEVGAMLPRDDGTLLVGTRLGDVYVVDEPYAEDPATAKFTPWARGLAQPLGFVELDGWIYTAQRGELTRIRDEDGDGRADVFETVCDAWEISGNYHEYNFGPRIGRDGKLWVTLNKPFGGEPWGRAHWRGWAVRIDPKSGAMEAMSAGLRSPAGVETAPWGDVFYTDNQGEWCNASKLSHLEHGDFHGHPHGLPTRDVAGAPFASIPDPESGTWMKDLHESVPQFKMPAVWFPYVKMGKSPSGLVWDRSNGKFGPFAGQLFVADQHHASVMRVHLEEVDGHWQGACFPFRYGFDCGITRVCQGRDGSLFVGMTNAGWGGRGTKPWGLARLEWTGEVPFEVATMSARADGFELTFTQPVDAATAGDPASYAMESYTYRLEKRYGGPEGDRADVTIESADVAADGRSVRLRVTPLRTGYVHQLVLDGVRAAGDPNRGLLHPEAYYTLVRLP